MTLFEKCQSVAVSSPLSLNQSHKTKILPIQGDNSGSSPLSFNHWHDAARIPKRLLESAPSVKSRKHMGNAEFVLRVLVESIEATLAKHSEEDAIDFINSFWMPIRNRRTEFGSNQEAVVEILQGEWNDEKFSGKDITWRIRQVWNLYTLGEPKPKRLKWSKAKQAAPTNCPTAARVKEVCEQYRKGQTLGPVPLA